jgi:hypothetical protein
VANLALAFAEILAGAIILDAGYKGDSVANVIRGQATTHPLFSGSGSGISTGGGSSTAGYVNPMPGASPSRVDAGGDYVLGKGGFIAPADSQIVAIDQRTGFGQYIAAEILDGPLKGAFYYVAEGITPVSGLHVNQQVKAGTQIAVPAGGGAIEAGWAGTAAQGNHDPLSHFFPGYGGDQSVQALTAGYSWARFVQSLGGPLAKFQGAGASLAQQIVADFAHPAYHVPFV